MWRSPEMGSQPSWAPKSDMRRRASQKSGVANPTKTKMVVILSNTEYCRMAESTPMGTATTTMMSSSMMFSASVTGIRSPILASTGRPSGRNERPKSSRATRMSQVPYCTISGLSRPYSSVSCRFTSGERSGSPPPGSRGGRRGPGR